METTTLIDVEPIAKHLKLELENVRQITELLEEGNTVPFITRFRKDHTGGLDEQQVRAIEKELNREKLLGERKETILKSIDSRGQLTDKLADQIRGARTLRMLEDIYLPYKPKKQSLASLARSKGLEPLAIKIIDGTLSAENLPESTDALVDEAKELPTVDAVLEGVQHLIAEHYCNHAKLRSHLRRHLWRGGKLASKKIEEREADLGDNPDQVADAQDTNAQVTDAQVNDADVTGKVASSTPPEVHHSPAKAAGEAESKPAASADTPANQAVLESESPAPPTTDAEAETSQGVASPADAASTTERTVPSQPEAAATETAVTTVAAAVIPPAGPDSTENEVAANSSATVTNSLAASTSPSTSAPAEVQTLISAPDTAIPVPTVADTATQPEVDAPTASPGTSEQAATITTMTAGAAAAANKPVTKPAVAKKKKEAASRRDQRRETRRRRRERLVQSFKDYFDFSDPIGRVPHHRILAINRGERTKVLRVKIECSDWDKFQAEAEATFVPQEHPHHEFLKKCFHYALSRLLLPSIEREVRRELNDKAEEHAVSVFARNLRKLLLQPPLCQHRVVAIDPGFRSGCKLVALDEFGQILGHTFINLLGKEQQKQDGRSGLISFVKEHKATAIAIGNGAACRETEALVADVLTNEFKDQEVGYLIVNEAGTSVYSTSDLGREELPNHDAAVRSAVSIGRRALDPLSELVKIDPASIGVGLYQHDVKAKHLRDSLDAVVESCVNYVGVDVNSASPALLRYVSGLNSLTARRIFEHRQKHGPFKNREQLKEVSGIGNSTYVQAAGFLKVVDGQHPLDETWIHPESYSIATKVLDAIGFQVNDLRAATRPAQTSTSSSSASATDAADTSETTTDTAGDQAALDPTKSTLVQPSAEGPAAIDPPADGPAAAESAEEAVQETPVSVATEPAETAAPVAVATAEPNELAATESAASVVATAESAPSETSEVAPSELTAANEPATAEVETTEATSYESDTHGVAVTEPAGEGATVDKQDKSVAVPEPSPGEQATPPNAPPHAGTDPPSRSRKSNGLAQELAEKLARVDVEKLAPELGVGRLLLKDILKALARPGRDPREDLPPPIFRRGILKLEDLKPEMELSGTVLNVVDFGAFVDIGLVDSGLIHVSRLADRYISDPHDVVSVGDILRVWVVEVDQKRRRVSLTAIEPGTERPKPSKESRKPRQARPAGRPPASKGRASKPPKKFARGAGQKPKEYKPKARPKPVVPITKEMEEGKEPMRTFGDLKQLFEKKKKTK